MSDPTNQAAVAAKKKNKRKKKKAAKGEAGAEEQVEKLPKQISDKDEQITTTAKCQRCKGIFRQIVQNGQASSAQQANWICPSCVQALRVEEERALPLPTMSAPPTSAFMAPPSSSVERLSKEVQTPPISSGGCNCAACLAKRENAVPPEVERDAHITQTYWMEIRHIVRCIYRDNMSLANQSNRSTIGSDKMRSIVRKLCSRDPHQFFQRLETLAREYLLEVKVRLLEQLSCGFNSPQLAIEFIQMLLDEYSTLCNALPSLLFLLEPLEESEYVQKLGVTIELMNKNIFRELIFAETFMSSNLPLIIAQLRLASLSSDPYHRNTADALSQRYVALDREMEDICRVWRSAKEQLSVQQQELKRERERRQHMAKIRADGESFKQMKQKAKESQSKSTEKIKSSDHNHRHSPPLSGTTPPSHSDHTHMDSIDQSDSTGKTSQLAEWSKLLFKCIKPIGEPEFRLNGDIATHTITLRLDMTELDLSCARATCTKDELRRYRKLGLTLEEIVEISMKLNALKGLGINLMIEDLFDEEGFSLADVNETLLGEEAVQDDVYFLEEQGEGRRREGRGEEGPEQQLSEQDMVDLQRAKDHILLRQETGNGRSRQNDFLQGMIMKIRFMKRLTVDDLEKNFVAEGGRVIFNSCDQVQMKLTQLELNSVRLVTSSDCIGNDLGLQLDGDHPPVTRGLEGGERSKEDYAFIHTDSHRQFMELLLEKRKQLEANVSAKQREKREREEARGATGDSKSEKKEKESGKPKASNGSTGVSPISSSSSSSKPDSSSRALRPPLSLLTSSQPCQCSACVGAMAAMVTDTSRPLNPTDPSSSTVTIESSLSSHVAADRGRGGKKNTLVSQISKEGVWQNWMSGSQLESESHLHNGTLHTHSPHYHGEGMDGYGDGLKAGACDHCHDHGPTISDSMSAYSLPYTSTHTQTGTSSPNYCSTPSSTTGSSNEIPRRYCPCCYCELFGHNGPPTAPTSHNFTKQRDKMRQKLEEKKRRKDVDPGKPASLVAHLTAPLQAPLPISLSPHTPPSTSTTSTTTTAADSRPVEELLAFIEGSEQEPQVSARAAKRQRRKQRKQQQSSQNEEEEEEGEGRTGTPSPPTPSPSHTPTPAQNGEETRELKPSKSKGVRREVTGQPTHLPQRDLQMARGGKRDLHTDDFPRPTPRPFARGGMGGSKVSIHPHGMRVRMGGYRNRMEQGNGSGLDELTPPDDDGYEDEGHTEGVVGMEEDVDEYDDELEAFKQFCFQSAPVEKKKITIALNMHDIMSNIKK